MLSSISSIKKGDHIHFIGIGGVSMSALATILIKKGFIVSGSDSGENIYTKRLIAEGATIYKGHKAENAAGASAVVYS